MTVDHISWALCLFFFLVYLFPLRGIPCACCFIPISLFVHAWWAVSFSAMPAAFVPPRHHKQNLTGEEGETGEFPTRHVCAVVGILPTT